MQPRWRDGIPKTYSGIDPSEGSEQKMMPAMLMAGEFVLTKDAVKGLGDGNSRKGIQRAYNLMDDLGEGIMAVQTVEIYKITPILRGSAKDYCNRFGEFDGETQTTPGLLDSPLDLPQFQIAGIDPLKTCNHTWRKFSRIF